MSTFAGSTVVAALVGLAPLCAFGQSNGSPLNAWSVDDLKGTYLACERASLSVRLSTAQMAQCSVIYEELKRRAFDGDFEKLLAWSRSHSFQASTARKQ